MLITSIENDLTAMFLLAAPKSAQRLANCLFEERKILFFFFEKQLNNKIYFVIQGRLTPWSMVQKPAHNSEFLLKERRLNVTILPLSINSIPNSPINLKNQINWYSTYHSILSPLLRCIKALVRLERCPDVQI